MHTKRVTVVLCALLLAIAVNAQPDVPTHPQLREELLKMAEADQKARAALTGVSLEEQQRNQRPIQRMMEVDRVNTKRLQAIVEKHGWPTITMVGEDGAHAAWLLAQHADANPDFQKKALEMMEKLLPLDEVRASHVAYLHDRITRPQRYGTQGTCVAPGKWQPHELEKPDEVDQLREKAGIQPVKLAEYIETMNQCCK